MFVSSFYCYLNYNQKSVFVIDLDDVWKWMGFQSKFNSKRMLEKNVIVETDYKILLRLSAEQSSHTKCGHNKETIMLTETDSNRFVVCGVKKPKDPPSD